MKHCMPPRPGAALLALVLALASHAQVTIDVFPTLAPNSYGSPSFAAWTDNAFAALYGGSIVPGDAGTPSYFSVAPATLEATDVFVTSFPSWRGFAEPGTVFGPAFANELGNRLHFAFVADGHGRQFALSQLSFAFGTTDPAHTLDFTFAAGDYNYSASYVGILFGADNQLGGGDDFFVTSGANTQLVDAVIGRGSGNAWWPVHTVGDGLSDQEVIDLTAAALLPSLSTRVTATYTLDFGDGDTVAGQAAVTIIPEPSTYALLLGGAAAAVVFWRRRRRATT